VIIYTGRLFKGRDVYMNVIVCKDYDEMSLKEEEFIDGEKKKKK